MKHIYKCAHKTIIDRFNATHRTKTTGIRAEHRYNDVLRTIITEKMNCRKICSRFMHFLTDEQNTIRILLKKGLTGDEN